MSEGDQAKWRGVRPTPASTLTSGQHAAGVAAAQIVAANAARDYVLVKNISANDVYVRPAAAITVANGELLHEGDYALYEGYLGAVFGITPAGAATLYYEEG